MQGWRPKMEDSHTVRFDLDSPARSRRIEGVFGVFDGHGGKEVALYCSNHLLDALTSISMFKRDEDIGACLQETFKRIDCSLLTKRGQHELKRLRAEDEHMICIHKDLFPMLSQRAAGASPASSSPSSVEKEEKEDEDEDEDEALGSASDFHSSEADDSDSASACVSSDGNNSDTGTDITCDTDRFSARSSGGAPSRKRRRDAKADAESEEEKRRGKRGRPSFLNTAHPIWERIRVIGEVRGLHKPSPTAATQEIPQAPVPRRRGPREKVCRSGVGLEILPRKRAQHHLDNPNMVCISKDEVSPKRPGVESGCTALVAAVESTEREDVKRLVVVNAGDSRCVLSRRGRAVELSTDHGPHLAEEQERIKRAGGVIGEDGRINGKLNLSRAIGDHQFKTQRNLSLREQMVTSHADVRSTYIQAGQDEFMVLACDGIWDAMSSQEVVDFCRERIALGVPLTAIGDQICKACLAKDVQNDPGTDNMSVLICRLFPPTPTSLS